MNELRRHKKSDKIKWVFTGIAFVLVAVMLTGVCLQLFGTGKQQPSNWFKKPDTEQTTPVPDDTTDKPVLDENGNELTSGVTHAMPAQMTFRTAKSLAAATPTAQAASEYDSVTLNATVKPDSATDKTVDWSIAWVNANSEWATGKTVTDYVTVTPQSDGSTTATVQCLQPFGEQIRVTVTSRMNTNATASCTVDFKARPSIIALTGASALSSSNIDNIMPTVLTATALSDFDTNLHNLFADWNVNVVEGVHTTGSVTVNSFKVEAKASDGLYNALKAQGKAYSTNEYRSVFAPSQVSNGNYKTNRFWFYLSLYSGGSDNAVTYVNKLNTAISNNSTSYDFELKVTVNTNMGESAFVRKFKVDRNSLVFSVERVELSGNIVI